MLTLEEAQNLWRQVPDECRRVVADKLARELVRQSGRSPTSDPSKEYSAFQAAHWLLWSALRGGRIYLNGDSICAEGEFEEGPAEEKLDDFFRTLPHGKYSVLTEGLVLHPKAIDLWIKVTNRRLTLNHVLEYGPGDFGSSIEADPRYLHKNSTF